MADLIRDPKTGRFYSRFESIAKQNALAAQQFGKSPSEQALIAIETTAGDDTEAVRSHMMQMVELVKQQQDAPAAEFRQVIPLINEVVNLAVRNDPTLSKGEKRRIQDIGSKLIQFVIQKTSVRARIATTTKNVARRSLNAARNAVVNNFGSSESVTFRSLARLLSRESRSGGGNVQGSIFQARSDAYQNLIGRQAQALDTPDLPASSFVPPAEEDIPEVPTTPTRVPRGDGSGTGNGQVLDQLLTQVRAIYTLMKARSEADIRLREQAFRDQDNRRPQRYFDTPRTPTEKKQNRGIFGSLADLFSMGGRDLLRALRGTLLPAFTKLAGGIAKVGAAIGAWEIGTFIGKKIDEASNGWAGDLLAKPIFDVQSGFAAASSGFNALMQGKGLSDAFGAAQQTQQDYQQSWMYNRQRRSNDPNWREKENTDANLSIISQVGQAFSENAPEAAAATAALAPLASHSVGQNVAKAPALGAAGVGAAASMAPQRLSAGNTMRMSEDGLSKLLKREGLPKGQREGGPYTAYQDVGGVWTIGHGLTTFKGKPVTSGMVISGAEEREEIRRQLRDKYEPIVQKSLGTTQVPQETFDALVSVAYNLPAAGRHLSRKLAKGQTLTADDFLASATVKGQRVRGLENRRMSEFQQASLVTSPSDMRAAGAIAEGTRATQGGNVVIVAAPQTVVAQNGTGGASGMMIPVPMTTENPDATLRAVRSINGA